ncbi:hypothetical protein LBMAG53_13490 [Planctomycetota bacterium]|nr:hypothetical protein LBMAG53_13490 [Planctomycetota bacterium]
MRILLGIGNPGREYHGTRHNIGFAVMDELARRHGVGDWRGQWHADTARIDLGGIPVLLLKPRTFVNRSGQAAQAALTFHRILPADLLVVVDDLNLPLGDLRLRAEGSAGGHNGLRDIEAHLGQGYARLRCGIGRPAHPDIQVDFVLGRFAPDEQADADAMLAKAADAAAAWVRDGAAAASSFNGPLRPPPPRPASPPKPPASPPKRPAPRVELPAPPRPPVDQNPLSPATGTDPCSPPTSSSPPATTFPDTPSSG